MTGGQYLASRIAELEVGMAMLIDQKAAVEKERDDLKAKLAEKEKPAPDA
jgi:hypothetical protein